MTTGSAQRRPAFLITIDTEGDNLWEATDRIETRNAAFLSRFQALCEKYGFKPTWLTNYEMASDPVFVEFGRDVLRRGQGEIGMHLHAWNSPPIKPLTEDDHRYRPYLIEYPDHVMRDKIAFMTDLLEDTFGVKMLSHRAGRWAFDERYARMLVEFGYRVDCSVTPGISWKDCLGAPAGKGGSDYSKFPTKIYRLDLNNVRLQGESPLLEVPMTILPSRIKALAPFIYKLPLIRRFANKLSIPDLWLRPLDPDFFMLEKVVMRAFERGDNYVEFMLHSSELMPAGSGRFSSDDTVELLYENIERLFVLLSEKVDGKVLSEIDATYISGWN